MQNNQRLPLEGLTILDASTMIAAPWAATYLADYGATVIKIEHPVKGDHARNFGSQKDGIPLFWKTLNRNKKAITLNLGDEKGQEIFKKLVKKADVVIENFRPGVFEKWNLSYDQLSKINPQLIMLSATGYGQDGPYSKRGGFGTVAEAMSGFASINGPKDGPPTLPGIPLADGVTSVFSALAIMIALFEKNNSEDNIGQHIDISIYEPLMRFLEPHMMNYNQLGVVAERQGNGSSTSAPRNAYQTKDGNWVALSGAAQVVAERIFKAIDREDLIDNEKFKNNEARLRNSEELDQIIGDWIIKRDMQEVIDKFSECGAVIGPMYDVKQIFEDEHFNYRESFVEVEDEDLGEMKLPNVFAKFSKTPGKVQHTGPRKGEHNDEIYKELLNMTNTEIKQLTDNKII